MSQVEASPRTPSVGSSIPDVGSPTALATNRTIEQAEPLGRHRVEAEGRPQPGLVGRGVPPPGGDHPRERPEDDGEERAEGDHRQRVLDRLHELVPDLLLRAQGRAEVAVEEAGDVEPVLRPRRFIQAELLADLLLELGAALAAAERVDRVARYRPEEDEVERDRDEHRHDREEDALDDVVGRPHARALARPSSVSVPIRPCAGRSSTSWSRRSGQSRSRPTWPSARRCTRGW